MSPPSAARLAAASPQFLEGATATQLEDWLRYFDPEIVLMTGPGPAPSAVSRLRRRLDSETDYVDPAATAPATGPQTVEGVQFVFASSLDDIRAIASEEGQAIETDEPVYVVSDLLELDVETTSLSTSLEGRDEYLTALSPAELDGDYVHLSTRLPAAYRQDWGALTVVGGGADAGDADTPLVALDCRGDGEVLTRTLNRTRLGLQALDGVGSKRAQRLREAGFRGRQAVADAETRTLADIQGLGQATAERIQQSARAITGGEVIRQSEAPLPSGDPVYVDIETDGLNPTIAWLIGVLDGSADTGNYRAFVQRDPDEPGGALEDFMAWYTVNASHRPLVAYHGWQFDFSVMYDHIVQYCPHYEEDWTSTDRFDPYQWAVEDGNAILPGRTNTLEDVADALGYERDETGLTGAAVARTYRRWMAARSPDAEPDWERFRAYCEDDVRGLAVVYEALEESGRIISTGETTRDVSETTTQGSLSDW
ncbi:MAG: ribonuclease H-like domain-containing protein [Halorhabdus sp.]